MLRLYKVNEFDWYLAPDSHMAMLKASWDAGIHISEYHESDCYKVGVISMFKINMVHENGKKTKFIWEYIREILSDNTSTRFFATTEY